VPKGIVINRLLIGDVRTNCGEQLHFVVMQGAQQKSLLQIMGV